MPFSVESCTETIGGEFFARLRPADPAAATVPAADDESFRTAEDGRAQREVSAMRVSRDAALAELAAMQRSRSWRITRPLRRLNAVLRSRRR